LAGMLRQVKALAPDCLSGLRITIFGGEQLPVATVTAWQKTAPNSTIYNFYGPTEATVYCLTQELIEPLPVTPGRDVIPIGTPLPGNEASIMDQHGQSAPDGSPGELVIAGVQLAGGYFGSPELTAARFPVIDGKQWYRTGDLALRDALGRFHCLGRLDNQVKVLGHRIELEEIDAHLRFVSGVDLVSSVAWPLVDGMARGVVAFVGASSINPETIVGLLKARIPAYMVPNRVITMQAMPLNTSGKVDRKALVQLLERDEL
jgi:D-alanine--poly(phosphoribitol) ligase subunit 1